MTFDVYTRVSKLGERSEDNLRSPELQEAACRDWAARAGLEIGEVASDKNVSGSTAAEERKLGRLIEKIERGESEGIITSYLDRFARDVMASWLALKRITEAGGRLVCVGDGFDSAASGSKESMGYRMVAAEAYLDRTRANFLAAQNGAANRGVYLAAKPPFGYRRKDEVEPEYDGRGRLIRDARLVVDEEEAALVRELFGRRAAGANFGELLRFLEERGVRMSKTGIRALLANRPYVAAVIEGSDAYERALADVEDAQQDLAAYRDNVEVQRLLGIEGFAAGLATRMDALTLARAKLAECRPASPPKLAAEWAGMSWEERRAEVGAWADRDALARFTRRVVVKPAESRRLPRRPRLTKEEWANPENAQAQAWLAANRAAVEERIVEVLFVGQPEPEPAEAPLPPRSSAAPAAAVTGEAGPPKPRGTRDRA